MHTVAFPLAALAYMRLKLGSFYLDNDVVIIFGIYWHIGVLEFIWSLFLHLKWVFVIEIKQFVCIYPRRRAIDFFWLSKKFCQN